MDEHAILETVELFRNLLATSAFSNKALPLVTISIYEYQADAALPLNDHKSCN